MKWGRKKAPSSTLPRPSLISSWLFKFKKMGSSSSVQKPDRGKHIDRLNSPVSTSSQRCTGRESGRFYENNGDAFWKISFMEDGFDGSSNRDVVQSAWYKPDEPERCCQSCRSYSVSVKGSEETQNFSSMVSDARKMREILANDTRLLPKSSTCRRETEEKLDTSRRVARKDSALITQESRCLGDNLSVVEEESDVTELKPESVSENDSLELGSLKTIWTNISHSRMYDDGSSIVLEDSYQQTSVKDDVVSCQNVDKGDGVCEADVSPDWQELKQMKIAEFKAKTEKHRKSVYMSRELQRNKPKECSKVRVFSPRTTSRIETCKIKALEDMKKTKRLKMKKGTRERMVGGKSNLENSAVVKLSYDLRKDFRDSMMEMIIEKRMHRAEELEELLACYLTLNSDEYHDLIIKVFKEVWFQLNQDGSVAKCQDRYCY